MYSIINDLLKRLNLVRDPEKALSIISHTAYKYIGFRKNNPLKILKLNEKECINICITIYNYNNV